MLNLLRKTLVGAMKSDSNSQFEALTTDLKLKTLHKHQNLSSYLELETERFLDYRTWNHKPGILSHEFFPLLITELESCSICHSKFIASNKKQSVYKCVKCNTVAHSLCFLTSDYKCIEEDTSKSTDSAEEFSEVQTDDENDSYYYTICEQDEADIANSHSFYGDPCDEASIEFEKMNISSEERSEKKNLVDRINDYDFSSLDRRLIKDRNIKVTRLKVDDSNELVEDPDRTLPALDESQKSDFVLGTLMQQTSHLGDHGPINPEIKSGDQRVPLVIGLRNGVGWNSVWNKDQVMQIIETFNSNEWGLSMQFSENPPLESVSDLLTGSIRVFINLLQPIKMASYNEREVFQDQSDQINFLNKEVDEKDLKKTITFKLPRGSTLLVHIGLSTTATQVIQRLLQRFLIKENPNRFALYEHTIHDENNVVVRKLFFDECPLSLLLRYAEDSGNDLEKMNNLLTRKRFVLQENDTEDIDWQDFGVSELKNFLRILYEKELNSRKEVQGKFKRRRKEIITKMSQIWEQLSDEDQALCNPPPVEEISQDLQSSKPDEISESEKASSNESLATTTTETIHNVNPDGLEDEGEDEFSTLPPKRELPPEQQRNFVKTMSLPRLKASMFGEKPKKKKTKEKKEKSKSKEGRSSLFSRMKKKKPEE